MNPERFACGLLRIAVGGITLAVFIGPAFPQPNRRPVATTRLPAAQDVTVLAQEALKVYTTKLVNDRNYGSLGFRSLGEARAATLGSPQPVMLIGLTDLKGYSPGAPPKGLLRDARALWFPVLVGGQTRTKLEMVQVGSRWVAGEFGSAQSAQQMARVMAELPEKLAAARIKPPGTFTLVKVPALMAIFIYLDTESGEYLAPAMLYPERLGLEQGRLYPAQELLLKLKEAAKDIDEKKVR